jgi:hypothetical protein
MIECSRYFLEYKFRPSEVRKDGLLEVFFMQRYSSTQINSELFWKFPKFLSENKKYADLSNDDRVAYMLIKDRYRYSLSNNWIDDKGDVYVYFTIEELRELLHVGKNKVSRVKQHLMDCDLLEIDKQGFDPKKKKNFPDRIYLLQPDYDPTDLISISQTSQVSALEQSGFPKTGSRGSNQGSLDIKGKPDSENCNKGTSTLERSDFPKMGTNKDKNYSDTIKDTNTDTQKWNFSPNSYSPEIVAEQNKDLLKHLSSTLTDDKGLPMFLNKESIDLITLWFKTPEAAHDCISVILNAVNDSRKEAMEQIGRHELYFEDYQDELKREVTRRLRRYFNKMRTAKPGEIKNPRSYLYTTMRNTFDKWQNDILVAEKEDSDNNKK